MIHKYLTVFQIGPRRRRHSFLDWNLFEKSYVKSIKKSPLKCPQAGTKRGLIFKILYADKRARPLARRRLIKLRPETVCIRERKPWRRLRTKTLG